MATRKNQHITDRSENDVQSVEQLNAILSGALFAIVTTDESGLIETFNPAAEKMFGYSAGEAIGKNVDVLVQLSPSIDATPAHAVLASAKFNEIEQGIGQRSFGRRKSGDQFPIQMTVSEAHTPNRDTFTVMVQDMSVQVKAEQDAEVLREQLHHVGRISAMGELVSALAHEVNQPLTAIITFASAAERVLTSDRQGALKKATGYIQKAGDEALRAGEIIRRLREFVELGETERRKQDIVFPIKEAAQLSLVGDDAMSIHLVWNVAATLPHVSIDRVQIQQVFQNLIRNAADILVGQSGEKLITINIKPDGDDHVFIAVEDNGPGLDPTIKDCIFMPFVTTKRHGMGIGLSISRTIVEAHKGEIFVEQPREGGARFCVRLPIGK